jgi:hypothetical protein
MKIYWYQLSKLKWITLSICISIANVNFSVHLFPIDVLKFYFTVCCMCIQILYFTVCCMCIQILYFTVCSMCIQILYFTVCSMCIQIIHIQHTVKYNICIHIQHTVKYDICIHIQHTVKYNICIHIQHTVKYNICIHIQHTVKYNICIHIQHTVKFHNDSLHEVVWGFTGPKSNLPDWIIKIDIIYKNVFLMTFDGNLVHSRIRQGVFMWLFMSKVMSVGIDGIQIMHSLHENLLILVTQNKVNNLSICISIANVHLSVYLFSIDVLKLCKKMSLIRFRILHVNFRFHPVLISVENMNMLPSSI